MSEPITVIIPGDPQGKQRPRFRKNGKGTYTPKQTRDYEGTIRLLASREMAGKEPLNIPVALELRAHFAIPQSWSQAKKMDALLGRVRPTAGLDVDNIVKAIMDGMNKVAYRDDCLVVSVTASKVYGQSPFVVATVKPINGSTSVSEA